MNESTTRLDGERAFRAVAGAIGLLVALIPVGFVFAAAFGAALSDNPDAHGPGAAGFLFGGALTIALAAGAAVLTVPPSVRAAMRPRHWIGAGALLAPVYLAAAIPTAFLGSLLDMPPLGWVVVLAAAMTAYMYVWAGVIVRWIDNQRPSSPPQPAAGRAGAPSQE
jgi:hypothetical protein